MTKFGERLETMRVAVIFGNADQRRSKCAEGVGQRSPLRHRGHRHPDAHRGPQRRTNQQTHDDPRVADYLEVHERADDGHQHAELGHMHPALRRFGMTQALQSEDEKDRSKQVTEFDEVGLPDHKNVLCTLCFVLCASTIRNDRRNDNQSEHKQSTKHKVQSPGTL